MTVEKDGYLLIEFMDGESQKIMFKDADSWSMDPKHMCLIVRYGTHHDRFPFANIRRFGPYYNSLEVIKALEAERRVDKYDEMRRGDAALAFLRKQGVDVDSDDVAVEVVTPHDEDNN